jgi:hypothetical protein
MNTLCRTPQERILFGVAAVNLLIKKVKRVGHGFRNFANCQLRLLLYCGVRWQTHPDRETARTITTLGGVEPVFHRR